MTAQQDPATGVITGHIPDEPRTCKCCGDQHAEMIDIRELTSDEPEWFCRDIGPCMERQAAREAAKDREPVQVPAAGQVLLPPGVNTTGVSS